MQFNKHRVFDCFLYNGEAGMLYTRLWRLDPYVDKFIIYAGTVSFSGKVRNLSTYPFEKEISKYESKIHWITKDVGCTPADAKYFHDTWCRENSARSALYPALKEYGPNQEDFIIFSDLDEIPIRYAMDLLELERPETGYVLLGYLTSPNYFSIIERWDIVRYFRWYGDFERFSSARGLKYDFFPLDPAATHCSSCFDNYEKYQHKLATFAHSDWNAPPFNTHNFIFKQNYCRTNVWGRREGEMYAHLRYLIPKDPRLKYLLDPSFRLDINRTNYTEQDLTTLCNFSKYKYRRKPFKDSEIGWD
ncbi:N-acetylglucosaminyltransferase, putative [Trichomonas vaginalis G3]|uniref:N-acetylglucosaminyltransferase, putative n=1 Tax=Trichomonas vaginalis (strain ATCC PRA-98 / G3) TaxID=412133 RepID=A2FVY7_TRIV3|nr:beta-1,4-mannosyl-glycoprotein beta-1,4-n-acetylglucosaminyl-transferase family [Trichomonas vaginalis G3]EAX90941.1 N-acetylglucosaminyltransferase, putative [Trichomonas vaginalis G3]KAI5504377.1 beta-1,4-mannosyl-glycoprotein beta-1,4-n-acetylglucosaminyl-transferase family [Trichomonas vaginalis G3]|eukprot:XP_001303871.1 N-acetylglucosaminyltransferase [Trichomonas vaginalis G3]